MSAPRWCVRLHRLRLEENRPGVRTRNERQAGRIEAEHDRSCSVNCSGPDR